MMNVQQSNHDKTLAENEQQILDTALLESDQLLARSLHDDQTRRRRRLWLSALVIGGVVMSVFILLVLFGVFSLGNADNVLAKDKPSLEKIQQADQHTVEGWKLWQQQRYVEAIKKFKIAVETDPKAVNAWNGLGWANFNSGNSEEAIAAFEKCVALQPNHPAALNGLGQIYLSWKEYDQAEKYLLMAAPQATAAHYGLTRLYLLTGEFKKALRWTKKVVAQNSKDLTAKKMLAAAKAKSLDDDLRRLIEPLGKPNSVVDDVADSNKGWKMFYAGNFRTAEQLFRRALEKDKENLPALNGLGFCLLNQGNHEQAKPLFEQILKQQKNLPGPMNGLARCLKAEGKVDEAIEVWEKIEEIHPGPGASMVGLAQTYLEREEFGKAVKYYQILVESAPQNQAYQQGLEAAQEGLSTK